MYIKKCFICGTEFDWDETDDECTYCNWFNLGIEKDSSEDEKYGNPVSIREAKKRLAQGLDIWGNPLPKPTK